jgi:hypothetical protein
LNIFYNKDTEEWAPEYADYYWPGKDKALRFFAVSGERYKDNEGKDASFDVSVHIERETTGEGASAVTKVAPTVTISNYKVDNTNPNTDLMVADFVRQDQNTVVNGEKGVVALSFRHALTKVEFLFKTDTEKTEEAVYVQSVTVAGLNTVSTLVVDGDGESLADKFDWREVSDPVPSIFTDDFKDPDPNEKFPTEILHKGEKVKRAPEDTSAKKLGNDEYTFCTWLAMPQSVEGKTVKVLYVIGDQQFERSFELDKGLQNKEWGVNQYVRYTVTLVPNKISFDSSVDDWSTTDVEDKEL